MKYVEDDSTIFWAIGPDSGVIAKHAAFCGNEVEIVVPFEGVHSGEVTILSFMPGSLFFYLLSSKRDLSMYFCSIHHAVDGEARP